MGMLTREQVIEINDLKIRIVNDLWAAENTALDEVSWARMRQRMNCIHHDLETLQGTLGLSIDEDEQSVPYPFSENGGGKGGGG